MIEAWKTHSTEQIEIELDCVVPAFDLQRYQLARDVLSELVKQYHGMEGAFEVKAFLERTGSEFNSQVQEISEIKSDFL